MTRVYLCALSGFKCGSGKSTVAGLLMNDPVFRRAWPACGLVDGASEFCGESTDQFLRAPSPAEPPESAEYLMLKQGFITGMWLGALRAEVARLRAAFPEGPVLILTTRFMPRVNVSFCAKRGGEVCETAAEKLSDGLTPFLSDLFTRVYIFDFDDLYSDPLGTRVAFQRVQDRGRHAEASLWALAENFHTFFNHSRRHTTPCPITTDVSWPSTPSLETLRSDPRAVCAHVAAVLTPQ